MISQTLILLVAALSFTSSQQMTCTYSFTAPSDGNRYQCELSINNPDGLDDADSLIGGVHSGSYMDPYGNLISSYNDSSVKIVKIVGVTKNIPSAICRQFPNVEVLNFSNSSIKILSATKCSKVTELRLSFNLIEEALIDLCYFQPALKVIYFNNNKLRAISNAVLNSCNNLLYFHVGNNQFSALTSTFFANTPNIQFISIGGNPITAIPSGIFNGLTELRDLYMNDLLITDLPLNIFPVTNKLNLLSIGNTRLTQYRPEWFQNLKTLSYLWISFNRIPISSNFFKTMPLLQYINMESSNISVVDLLWFSSLTSLSQLKLNNNNIVDIPTNAFTMTPALKYLDLHSNKLKIISSKWFSTLTLQSILDVNVDDNEVNAIDSLFFEYTTNLNVFSLNNNKCYTGPRITDFLANRSSYMPGFKTCIDNFAYQNW